jgi:hypothetical protein
MHNLQKWDKMAKLNRRRRWRGPALGGRLQRGVRFCFTAHNGEASTPTLTEWASFHRWIVLALLGYFIFNRGGAGTARGGYPIKMVPPPGFSLRLEWTLSRKPAVVRHLGGNRIDHLLTADLGKFLERNLRLERVDYLELGYLLGGIPARRRQKSQHPPASNRPTTLEQLRDPDYRARRRAFVLLRWLANREETKFADYEQALWICQHSPAQIRGCLKEWRDGMRPRRRGRPKVIPRRRRRITDYQIERYFRRIKPVRV